MLLKRYKINNNLSYFLYPTKKYKSFSVKIYFLLPYDKNKITIRNLLKSVLLYNTKKYNEVALVEKKKELYNLRINIDNSIINNMQQFTFSISGTNPKYFNDEEYTISSILEYLNEIIFNPNIENNKFNEESFNMCFNRYKIALKTSMEDKNTLAFFESINLIKDKENKYFSYGYLKDFDKITNELLYKEYLELINSKIIIACIGDLNKEELKYNFNKYFNNYLEYTSKVKMKPTKYQDIKEKVIKVNTEQAIMILTFATEVNKFKEDYFNLLIFNMLFGGEANSKLFQVIREEYGFCYEIYSSVDANSGLLTVYIGLDERNIDKAKLLILEQIEEIKKGNFSKKMINEYIQNENLKVKTVYDSMNSTLAREISLYLYDRDSSFKLLKEDLNKVTKESIQNVAHKVKHINTVIIKSKGGKK